MGASKETKTSLALTADEQARAGCQTLQRLAPPVWFFDFDAYAVVWANSAGLRLWNGETVEDVASRRMKEEMSPSVEERLHQFRDDFERDPSLVFREVWTLYPRGQPRKMECAYHDGGLSPGRRCSMIIARQIDEHGKDPEISRSLDTLLHSRVMTALYDREGYRLFVNRTLRKAIGTGSSGGRFGDVFVNPADREPFFKAVRNSRSHRATVNVATSEGPRWHDIETSPCKDAATGNEAFQCSSVDVTEIAEYAEQLQTARDQAERANASKSEFLANMSHEMRTPMNGVLGMLEILRHSELEPDQAEMVRIAQASGAALLELINDVLDLSSMELNAVSVSNTAFEMRSLAKSVVEGLSVPAANKKLTLNLDVDPLLPSKGFGDSRRIAQVMRNLVSNAIKYTDQGHITLYMTQRPEHELLVEVQDTGQGVTAEHRKHIFNRFHQEPQTSGHRADGVGLGLAICKEIVSLWGGEITVDARDGGGSIFAFSVPGALDPSHFPAVENQTVPPALRQFIGGVC